MSEHVLQSAMRRTVLAVGLVLLSALHFLLALRWAAHWSWSFDSDEAIFGLMARHIQQGHFPLFYYGQSYLGSFSSFVLAGLAHVIGHGPSTVKLLAILFSWLAYLLFSLALARRSTFGALLFFALAVLISPAAHLWTAFQRGPTEQLFTMGLVLLTWLWWQDRRTRSGASSAAEMGLLGLVIGFALWNHLGMGIILLPLILQEGLRRHGYGEWRRRFRLRDFLGWSDPEKHLPGRVLCTTVIAIIALAEVVALLMFAGAAKSVAGAQTAALLGKLRYLVVLGLAVIGLLLWYHDNLTRQGGKGPAFFLQAIARQWLGGVRLWFLAGFALGVSPAVAGLLRRPEKVQFPMPATLPQILAQIVHVFPVTWKSLFGLSGGNPVGDVLTLMIIGLLAWEIRRRRSIWASLLRLQPVSLDLEDVLTVAIFLNLLVFLLGDLAPGSTSGFRYLVPVPVLIAALLAVMLASEDFLPPGLRIGSALALLALTIPGQLGNFRDLAALSGLVLRSDWNRLDQEPATDSLLRVCRRLDVQHLESDYWQAYRLTYLSGERLIVAADNGIDRYPLYQTIVRSDPDHGYLSLGVDSLAAHCETRRGLREMVIGDYRLFLPVSQPDSGLRMPVADGCAAKETLHCSFEHSATASGLVSNGAPAWR